MFILTFDYFVFLICLFLFYFNVRKHQKSILFIFSILFYVLISISEWYKILLIVLYMMLITYSFGVLIGKNNRFKSSLLLLSIFLLIFPLIYFKYLNNIIVLVNNVFKTNFIINDSVFQIIGISYYALSAIGYLIEVYWGNICCDKNIINVGLFIFYFPVIVSGPILRYNEFSLQFNTNKNLEYDRFVKGAFLMAWGYFKKLVVANRFSIPAHNIYNNFEQFSGVTIILATLCYAVELYADFSGCMDIIGGTSMILGVKLPKNFDDPFFSTSIQEFWQRWHITLGLWFKDYVLYPIQKTEIIIKIGKKSRKLFGKRIGKRIPFYISMIVLWFLIGLWHGGTDYYFVASGLVPLILIIITDIFSIFYNNHNIYENKYLNYFTNLLRRFRTILLVSICWVFVLASDVSKGIKILYRIFTKFIILSNFHIDILRKGLNNINLTKITLVTIIFVLLCFFIYDVFKNIYKIDLFEKIFIIKNRYKVVIIYLLLFLIIFLQTMNDNQFIYFQF